MLKKNEIEIKTEFEKNWLKIFYHNVRNGVYFESDDEVLRVNKQQKFSIIGLITPEFKINGYYEFLLEYPEVVGHNNWKQKIFPRDANETIGQDVGYKCEESEGCSCSWTGRYWKGLSRSSLPSFTYIDGSFITINSWFAIGVKTEYNNEAVIPGPAELNAKDGIPVHEVYLWIRCSQRMIQNLLNACTCYSKRMNLHIIFLIFCELKN